MIASPNSFDKLPVGNTGDRLCEHIANYWTYFLGNVLAIRPPSNRHERRKAAALSRKGAQCW